MTSTVVFARAYQFFLDEFEDSADLAAQAERSKPRLGALHQKGHVTGH